MPLMNSPLPRGGLGTLRESSTMRSIRDRDSVGNAWKTTNTNAAQLAAVVEAVNRQGRTINKLRRRVPTLIQPPTQVILPFTVYNVGNVLNGSDSWRTFQMRDGLIGFRSKNYTGSFSQVNSNPTSNYESQVEIWNDGNLDTSQPSPSMAPSSVSADQQVIFSNSQDTLISGYDVNGNPIAFYQFLPDNTWDQSSVPQIHFSIWAEIIDVPNSPDGGPYANLWGRMFTGDPTDSTGRGMTAFPNPSPNIIQIAVAVLESGTTFAGGSTTKATGGTWTIYQLQAGHLLNRFPSFPPPDQSGFYGTPGTLGSPLNFRGNWTSDAGMNGQVFWPGDLVAVNDSSVSPFTQAWYVHLGVSKETDVPSIAGNWFILQRTG